MSGYWTNPNALSVAIIEIAYAGAGKPISTEAAEALAEELLGEDDKRETDTTISDELREYER
jgi:hypothetical protein